MQMPPTPPVDPENEEFIIFVRSKRLPRWLPLSIMKGGGTANMLVKSMGTDFGKSMSEKTLIQNVGRALYKEEEQIKQGLRDSMPLMKHVTEIEFAFKIRRAVLLLLLSAGVCSGVALSCPPVRASLRRSAHAAGCSPPPARRVARGQGPLF
jgi:hypothetical protein